MELLNASFNLKPIKACQWLDEAINYFDAIYDFEHLLPIALACLDRGEIDQAKHLLRLYLEHEDDRFGELQRSLDMLTKVITCDCG